MNITLSGEISKLDYDKVVDLERIEFTDKKNKMDCYVEIPRLNNLITFTNKKEIEIVIANDEVTVKKVKEPTLVLNSVLYVLRKTDKPPKEIIQFSSGGIIIRLITDVGQKYFKLRGNRSYQIAVK